MTSDTVLMIILGNSFLSQLKYSGLVDRSELLQNNITLQTEISPLSDVEQKLTDKKCYVNQTSDILSLSLSLSLSYVSYLQHSSRLRGGVTMIDTISNISD